MAALTGIRLARRLPFQMGIRRTIQISNRGLTHWKLMQSTHTPRHGLHTNSTEKTLQSDSKLDGGMPPKREKGNEFVLAGEVISKKQKPMVTILDLMRRYSFSTDTLMQYLIANGLEVNLSDVIFSDVAKFAGLNGNAQLRDIAPFELHRSRIPSALFDTISKEMDLTLKKCGYDSEDACIAFIAPLFTHLLGQFDLAIRDTVEARLLSDEDVEGRRIEHQFTTFTWYSAIVTMFQASSQDPDMGAMAQLIASSYACEWRNSKDYMSMPVFGILHSRDSFEFYKFDGSLDAPKFLRGYHGNEYQFRFPDCLRIVTEIIFDMMLTAYSSSLKKYHFRTVHLKEWWYENNVDWDKAIEYADSAQQMFRDGHIKHIAGQIEESNRDVLEAMKKLKLSTDLLDRITLVHSKDEPGIPQEVIPVASGLFYR